MMRALLLVLIFSSCAFAPKVKKHNTISTSQKKISYRFLERWVTFSEKDGRDSYYTYYNVDKTRYLSLTSYLQDHISEFVLNTDLKYHKIETPKIEHVSDPYSIPLLRPDLLLLDSSDYYIDFILESPRNLLDLEKLSAFNFVWVAASIVTLTIIPSPAYTLAQLRVLVYDKNFRLIKEYTAEERDRILAWLPYFFMKGSKFIDNPNIRLPTFDNAISNVVLQMKTDNIFEK